MLPSVEEEAKTESLSCVAPRGGLPSDPETHGAPTLVTTKAYEGWQPENEESCAVVGWGSALVFNAKVAHSSSSSSSSQAERIGHPVQEISAKHSFRDVTQAYFEAQVVQHSQKLSALFVGFSPATKSTSSISSGVFLELFSNTVWLNGEALPPSAWMRHAQQQATRQVNEDSHRVVGAGVDVNGRVFFTVNGQLACVPLTFINSASHGADHHRHHHCSAASEARGHPVRLMSSWTARTVVASFRTKPSTRTTRIHSGASVAGSDQQSVDALVMCNVGGDSSGTRPFEFMGANRSCEVEDCDAVSTTFASVSQWLACTGWSPLADRVVIPRGQLPTECALPQCRSRFVVGAENAGNNQLTTKSSSLFRGPPCFAPFSWASIFQDGPEGRAAKVSREATARVYKDITYHIMHTGGFVRLCTARGRALWMAQNATGHRSPDWKLHFSVALDDIPHAWDLLASLFVERGCEVGIKATYSHLLGGWSENQRGREITLYIFCHDKQYTTAETPGGDLAASAMERLLRKQAGNVSQVSGTEASAPRELVEEERHRRVEEEIRAPGPQDDEEETEELRREQCGFWLGEEFERPPEFFTSLVAAAEARLKIHGIRSRGCADGDLPLGTYTSVRNEAYVLRPVRELVHSNSPSASTRARDGDAQHGEHAVRTSASSSTAQWVTRRAYIYPRNVDGWNAAQHPVPISIFDCRCAAAGLPVETARFKLWQQRENRILSDDDEKRQATAQRPLSGSPVPLLRWLE